MASSHDNPKKPVPLEADEGVPLDESSFEFNSSANGDATIFVQTFCAKSIDWRAAPVLLLHHGYGAHSGFPAIRFLSTYAASKGFYACAMDAYGHGRSSGVRGKVLPAENLAADMIQLAQKIQDAGNQQRIFVGGGSMGGAVAISAAILKPTVFAGVLLLAPLIALNPAQTPPRWQIRLLRAVACLFPDLPAIQSDTSDPHTHFREASLAKHVERDALKYDGRMRLSSAQNCLEMSTAAFENAKQLNCPILLIHGQADTVVPFNAGEDMIKQCQSSDKQLYEVSSLHGVLCDPPDVRNAIAAYIVEWMQHQPFIEKPQGRRCIIAMASKTAELVDPLIQRLKTSDSSEKPIVYAKAYNISFWGIEQLHPFDSKKFGRAMKKLAQKHKVIPTGSQEDASVPIEATDGMLSTVHTLEYLHRLRSSSRAVAQACELAPLAMMSAKSLDQHVLMPMRLMASGTVLAAALALKRQACCVNMGGGMHHAEESRGKGWCVYADIPLAVSMLSELIQRSLTCLYVDVDVHQGDGVELYKLNSMAGSFQGTSITIVDAFNASIFPGDVHAEQAADYPIRLKPRTGGEEYMQKLRDALDKVFISSTPSSKYDLCILNAGTDPLDGDPLGGLCIPHQTLVDRDELIVHKALHENSIPVVMLLSGGYTQQSASVVADSVANLSNKGYLK